MHAGFSPFVYTSVFLLALMRIIFQLISSKKILKTSGIELIRMSAFRMHMLFPLKERAGNARNVSDEYLKRASQGKTHLFELKY